jgi:Cu-Zn family superoxide dismutase
MKPFFTLSAAAVLAAACGSMGAASGPKAVAQLEPTKGNTAAGTVTFTQHGDMVRVNADLSGLKPGAQHGFHVHDKGDCSSGDGMSTGGHYNPKGTAHGPQSGIHHGGDMPGIQADDYGKANATFELAGVTATEMVGHGLIVHRDPDDYTTQPTGNAGPRIACAVIKAA